MSHSAPEVSTQNTPDRPSLDLGTYTTAQRKGFASLWESEQGRESEGERARTLQLLCWLSGNSMVNHGKKQPGLIKPAATLWVPISRRPHRRPLVPAFLLRPCWVRLPISICERISSKNKATR